MKFKIDYDEIKVAFATTYSYRDGLFLPPRKKEAARYISEIKTIDRITYEAEYFVASASLRIERLPAEERFLIEIFNIHDKLEYDYSDREEIIKSINKMRARNNYIDYCKNN